MSEKLNGITAEQLEKFRRKQIMEEREKFGMHRFAMYIPNVSQKKRRKMARQLGK